MRLGLIARADNRGLGQQTWAVYRNMQPAKTMVIDCPSLKPLPMHYNRFPDATIVTGWPTQNDFCRWLDGLEVVYTAETGYSPYLWSEAQRHGVKTVLHANYEFLDTKDRPTLWAAPSMWHFNEFPTPRTFLPVPIETDRFRRGYMPENMPARRFMHVVGRPAVHDRNGTADLLAALRFVKSDIRVTVKCQEPGYVESLIERRPPANVELVIDSGDVLNYWDNYGDQDVLLMPRRFGGLCLPVNEALGAGMPVIMPNISPNNTWLPEEWLVPATRTSSFMAKKRIDVYTTHPQALAEKIDELTNPDVYSQAYSKAAQLRDQHSWGYLKPQYERVFAAL